jgi:cysteine-rich repeat protein
MELRRIFGLSAALWALAFMSCVETDSELCPSGRVCGPGLSCAAIQDTCIDTPCGDGVVEEGETCDDGNILDGDGCSRDCRSDEACGNGRVDVEAREVCDDGNTRSGDGCSADCKSTELCGNGIIDSAVGEVCDDGDIESGDACSGNCRSDERCGNGIVDAAAGEVCDDGNLIDGDGCSSNCRSGEGCGNGIRDPDEECDDGNASNEDNCLTTCVKASCRDGFTDREAPGIEECDTGGESAACNSNCTAWACGDGIVNRSAGEQCDNRGALSSSTCDSDCSLPACGDGVRNEAAGEECDDRDGDNQDNCTNLCKFNTCGDRYVDLEGPEVEVCDDGNRITEEECPYGTRNCTACRSDCMEVRNLVGPVCGDGIQNGNEACDDGNTEACGSCNATCTAVQLAKATGTIKVVAANQVGVETFSVGDGVNVPVIFEFDRNGEVEPGHVPVFIQNSYSRELVAGAIVNAINGEADSLQIVATIQGGDTVVLTHELIGSFGNVPISEQVAEKNFQVNGMSEGKGFDCPEGTACSESQACKLEFVCLPENVCGEPVSP